MMPYKSLHTLSSSYHLVFNLEIRVRPKFNCSCHKLLLFLHWHFETPVFIVSSAPNPSYHSRWNLFPHLTSPLNATPAWGGVNALNPVGLAVPREKSGIKNARHVTVKGTNILAVQAAVELV
jgi:hypothetical protein